MATVLGKRKTRHVAEEPSAEALAKAHAIFQRHFESSFAPLSVTPLTQAPADAEAEEDEEDEDQDEDNETITDESESGWEGLSNGSEDEEDDKVEIVNHVSNIQPATTMSRREMKAFMSSRPPSDTALALDTQKSNRKGRKSAEDHDEDSQAFLANDLALQRLIAESHILSRAGGNPSQFSSSARGDGENGDGGKLFAAGRTRRLTTEMRLERAMGREAVVPKPTKMPMAMRKGINRHALEREEKRRREAKANGIVLERRGGKTPGKMGKTGKARKRGEAPVDLPSVGKMRGSELRISARDVRSIHGPATNPGLKKRKKRR